MIEEKQMSWSEWYSTYQPLMHNATMDDGGFNKTWCKGDIMMWDTVQEVVDFIKTNYPNIHKSNLSKHVWTETGGDGWDYTSTGFHYCDRMHHFICLVPWKQENEACMYQDYGTWCDYCDEYVHTCEHEEKLR